MESGVTSAAQGLGYQCPLAVKVLGPSGEGAKGWSGKESGGLGLGLPLEACIYTRLVPEDHHLPSHP